MKRYSLIFALAALLGFELNVNSFGTDTKIPNNNLKPKSIESRIEQPLERIVEELNPNPKKPLEQRKDFDDLYRAMAVDINNGKSIVTATYLGLWIDGKPPEQNLYWGMQYGHFRMFERATKDPHIAQNFQHHNWQRVFLEKRIEDPSRIAVYGLTVKPNEVWKFYGVTKEFKIYSVFLVYQNLQTAIKDLTLNIAGEDGQKIKIDNGAVIDLASDARLMGYFGHNMYFDSPVTFLDTATIKPDKEKGVYFVGCVTARDFTHRVLNPNLSGLLFTTSLMAPEGYNLLALLDSVAQGHNGRQIAKHANNAYRYFQTLGGQKQPGNLFVNEATGTGR